LSAARIVFGLALSVVAAGEVLAQAPTSARAAIAVQAGSSSPGRFDLTANNAPATQVFMQLASGTQYDILVSPEVSGNVTITLKDTTVLEALDSMRELYGYDYRVVGNRIFVQPNTVQSRLFKINYLSGRRQGASDIRVTSSSMSGSGGNGSSGYGGNSSGSSYNSGGNNSTTVPGDGGARSDDNAHVRTTSDHDFWLEVKASLVALVGAAEQRSVVLNPAAGVIVVRATPAELRLVEAYLKAMQLSIERQVMIEAKIVSVELNVSAQAGVNWAAFGRHNGNPISFGAAAPGASLVAKGTVDANGVLVPLTDGVNSITTGVGLAASAIGQGFYGLAFQASNFAAMLNFLESQGNVQVLSSPRIATLNNQKAVLKVGSDELFVTGVSSTTTTNTVGAISTPSVILQPFFSGVALDVTPQIDDSGIVMLHVHPTVSNVTEKTKNIDLGTLGNFTLPLALSTVSETDSIVRVRHGQIVAIGGLMTQNQSDARSGLPGVSSLPIIGALFRQKSASLSKRELVILIKPTVIGEDGPWPEANVPPPMADRF
jgi:MSHA biogenesis protein MshL